MLKPFDRMTVRVKSTMDRDIDNTVTNVFFRFLPILANAMEKMEIPFLDTFLTFLFLERLSDSV